MTAAASPRYRLAFRTSSWQCAHRIHNGFITTVYGIFNSCITVRSLHGSSLSIHVGNLGNPPKRSSTLEMACNIHNHHQGHRDRSACAFRLVS